MPIYAHVDQCRKIPSHRCCKRPWPDLMCGAPVRFTRIPNDFEWKSTPFVSTCFLIGIFFLNLWSQGEYVYLFFVPILGILIPWSSAAIPVFAKIDYVPVDIHDNLRLCEVPPHSVHFWHLKRLTKEEKLRLVADLI